MRYQGKITEWRDAQAFGFITQNGDGQRLFLHIQSFSSHGRRPRLNDIVTYEIVRGPKGLRAETVRFIDERSTSSTPVSEKSAWPLYLVVLFVLLIGAATYAGYVSWKVPAFYLTASLTAFFYYWIDKSAARHGKWRIQERTLHMIGLIGGWPGGLLAQRWLRHKSSKSSFRSTFWATVILHCGFVAWLCSPYGQDMLMRIAK
jgi:uncharacterized membrane protein YsdA (DUF1294 family)/cold shock CspA family protein